MEDNIIEFKKIMETLEELEIPEGYEREMIIIGNRAFSITEKSVNFLGSTKSEKVLEKFETLEDGVIFAQGYAHRVLYENHKVLAIEFLKIIGDQQAGMEEIAQIKQICPNCSSDTVVNWTVKIKLYGDDVISYWSCRACGHKFNVNRLDREGEVISSVSFSQFPIDQALKYAKIFLGTDSDWTPVSDEQSIYLIKINDKESPKVNFSNAIATTNAKEVELFLMTNRFQDAKVKAIDPNSLVIAGLIKQKVLWKYQGGSTKFMGRNGIEYDGVEFPETGDFWQIYDTKNHSHPVVEIKNRSGNSVFMTYVNEPPKNHAISYFDMIEIIRKIAGSQWTKKPYSTLTIPKINYHGTIQMDWILKMKIMDDLNYPWFIQQAFMQSKIQISNFGKIPQTELYKALKKDESSQFIIDIPFLIWFMHGGKISNFAYITEKHWADPGNFLKET